MELQGSASKSGFSAVYWGSALPMAALRLTLTRGVWRAAFLVQTVVGLLQVRRFLRAEDINAKVFDSEAAALAHLAEAPR